MLQHAPGAEPEIVLVVRTFRRWLVGRGDDVGTTVRPSVEGDVLALLDIGIVTFTITPQRFLAIDHRPAQAAHLVVGIVRRQFVTLLRPFLLEAPVFLEQTLLHIETEVFHFMIVVSIAGLVGHRLFGELVDLAIGEQYLVQGLAAVFRVFLQQLVRPGILCLETFGKFHHLPEIGF